MEKSDGSKTDNLVGLTRRDFLRLAGWSAGALVAGGVTNWLKNLGFIPADTDPREEKLTRNILAEGANCFVDEMGDRYKIQINRNAVAALALEVAEREGGTRLVGRTRSYLTEKKIRIYISPLPGILSLLLYPHTSFERLGEEFKKDAEKSAKGGNALANTLHPFEWKGATGYSGMFLGPEDTTDQIPAVLLSSGVVYSTFYSSRNEKTKKLYQSKFPDFAELEVFTETSILGHELWHLVRYIDNPERERETLMENPPDHPEEKLIEQAETALGLSAGTIQFLRKRKMPLVNRLVESALVGMFTKSAVDPLNEPYPKGPDEGKAYERMWKILERDPTLIALHGDSLMFIPIEENKR